MNTTVVNRLIRRASKSFCRYKISAIGLGKKGEVISYGVNKPRFERKGGGLHAEMVLMAKYQDLIKTIIICRVNNRGKLRPIHPCQMCRRKAKELGIRILTVHL